MSPNWLKAAGWFLCAGSISSVYIVADVVIFTRLKTLDRGTAKGEAAIDADPRDGDRPFPQNSALVLQASETANQVRHTTIEERKALAELTADSALTIQQFRGDLQTTLRGVDGVLGELQKTARVANSETLPALDGAIKTLDRSVLEVADSAKGLEDAGRTLVESADKRVEEPAIEKMLADLQRSAAHLETSNAEVAETFGYIRDMFKPTKVGFWHNLASNVIPLGLGKLVPGNVRVVNAPTVKVAQ